MVEIKFYDQNTLLHKSRGDLLINSIILTAYIYVSFTMVQQVVEIDLFRVLRKDLGEENLDALVREKIVPVPGDISVVNLGVKDSDLLQLMWSEIDVIINIAATTNFDERYYKRKL